MMKPSLTVETLFRFPPQVHLYYNQRVPNYLLQAFRKQASSFSANGNCNIPASSLPAMLPSTPEMAEKPICTICEKRFQNVRNLKIHLISHAGVRPSVPLYVLFEENLSKKRAGPTFINTYREMFHTTGN